MIKVLFNGYITNIATGGCVPCGQKRSGKRRLASTLHLELPSGTSKTFRRGYTEEVSELDYDYLRQHGYITIGGETMPVFEVVE